MPHLSFVSCKNVADNRTKLHESVQCQWLLEINHRGVSCRLFLNGAGNQAAHDDDGRLRVVLGGTQALKDFLAAALGKVHVHDEQIERRPFGVGLEASQKCDRLRTIADHVERAIDIVLLES